MVSRSALADTGLGLLAVVTLASAGYVLVRDPNPTDTSVVTAPSAAASPSAVPSAVALPSPSASRVDVVLLRSAATPSGHVVAAARQLGWGASNAPLDDVQPAALADQEVVLVQVGQDDQDEVLDALPRLRASAPSARLVVVAPLVPVRGGTAPQQLATAVERVGGTLLDPAALGWLQDPAGVFALDGSFTAQGAQSVGRQLAGALV